MMLLAAASLAVPSAFSRYFAPEGTIRQEELLNLGIAGVLLLTYGLYLLFSVKTHPATFASVEGDRDEPHGDGNLGACRSPSSASPARRCWRLG